MSISSTVNSCERIGVNAWLQVWRVWLVALTLFVAGISVSALPTNGPSDTNAPSHVEPAPPSAGSASPRLDESAFRLIAERNIFNANRSGGQVRLATRRPARIETFSLVGTLAYEKGAFAFFEGSSSEFTKVVKADSVIAGYKLVDIYPSSVKLEADGKQIELLIGSQMRREDAGTWQIAQDSVNAGGETGSSPGRNGDVSGRSGRSRRSGDSAPGRSETAAPTGKSPATAAPSSAEQSEILKRLMERREKESP
jgi:hypothetical protein